MQVATILQYVIVEQSSRLIEVVGPDYVDQVVDLASLQQCIFRLKQARANVEIEAAERMKFAKMLASELDADNDKRMQMLDQLREDKQKTLERLRDDKKRLYEEAYTPTSKKNVCSVTTLFRFIDTFVDTSLLTARNPPSYDTDYPLQDDRYVL